jgi:hypothetical protein
MPHPSPGRREPDPMAGVVDRLLAQLPGLQGQPYAPPRATRQAVGGGMLVQPQPSLREDLFGPTTRLILSLALGTMIAWWPYPRSCGLPLVGYFSAILTIIVGGGWAAVSAWRHRAGLTHVLSLILMVYGLMLAAAELLPRTGYAVDHADWQCEETSTHFTSTVT